MGQGFSLTTLSPGTAGIDVPELSDLTYEKTVGSHRFMKSIRARHQDGVVLVKVVIKPYAMRLERYKRRIIEERKALADVPNALAYQRIVETETNGFLVRQYLYSSLYDRMSTRPFLEEIEKKWLAFQLLCGIRDCHSRGIFHGDIKTENVLVTSWNWLYLSDFSSSFKPTTLPEDNPADFSYFFDTAGRRTCYLAPERFLAPGETPDPKAPITWAMDVFSAGCVIAELFLEAPIFNLSQLYKYRRGEYDPVMTHLNKITNTEIRDMIAHMIQLDPDSRYAAEEYLNFWRKTVFPEYFFSFLHQYMALITDPSSGRTPISGASANLGEADERIDRIYFDFDKISFFLDYDTEKSIVKTSSYSSRLGLFPVHLNIPNNEHQASVKGKRPKDDGTLIFLSLVVSSFRNTARATAKIRACDLLLAFSEKITDEAKLDRVLPYLVTMLNDKADTVKIAAIRTLTQLMALVTVVSPVNAHVFPEYILPRMQVFLPGSPSEPSPIVRATYAACLGSLATSASRFLDMVATLRADGSLPTADPEAEDGSNAEAAFQGLFDNARAELIEVFATHTKALITDNDSAVRRAFLGSVQELCMFFGTADSNDIILSHLNTYLNDRNWMLKCAFFETIVGVATFLGGTSLEEFILPLMVPALTDPEDFVVRSVLFSLASMAELGLFQRSKTWELVDMVSRFSMHPNIWIREATAMFISAATRFLSIADIQCIVLPLIKPYLKTSIQTFQEVDVLDNLKRSLPRPVLDLAVMWAIKADRGIFWKPVHQLRTFSFESNSLAIPTISSKELGHNALQKVPKNEEDEQWLNKLRNMGLAPEDEFKLLCLREYIWRLALSKSRETAQSSSTLNNIINLRSIGITPQTVMFDDRQPMDEPLRQLDNGTEAGENRPHTIADALLDASMSIDDSLSRRRRSAFNTHNARLKNQVGTMSTISSAKDDHSSVSPSPALSTSPKDILSPALVLDSRRPSSARGPLLNGRGSDDETGSSANSRDTARGMRHKSSAMNLMSRTDSAKTNAETGTTSMNAFGKVEGPFSQNVGENSPLAFAKEQDKTTKDNIRYRGAHTYSGNDPNILKMLDDMYIENYPNDTVEFGPMIAPSSRRKTLSRSTSQPNDKPWKPEGILVATFAEHTGPIRHIAVAPDHAFFLTGGDDGSVRVWDTGRLERNLTHRSRQVHKHAIDAKITALCFVEHTHSFVSCASDGSINVARVECLSSGGAMRYGKLRVLREYLLPEGEVAVWADHFKIETSSTLLVATDRSRVLAMDLRRMEILYTLENPVHHGTPTCFVVDRKRQWLLLGTSHGVLDLWDLRFKVRLKAWGVPGATAIYRMCLHPIKGRGRWVCVAGGSGQGEITVWDIEKTQCREVYRAAGGNREGLKGYDPWPVDEDRPEGMLGRFATALEPTGSSNSDRGIRAMIAGTDTHDDNRESKYGFIVAGGADKKIRFWDVAHVENSMVVSGLDAEEPKPTFTTAHPTASLTLNTERIPRPNPTAPNAGSNSRSSSTSKSSSGRTPRSTVISLQQQQLLRSHLDSILDIALLESPYGMMVSVDRSGVIFVFQ